MDKFRFVHWPVYKDSKLLMTLVLKIIKKIPNEYRFEIGSQMSCSALSVVLNIAEGCGKSSDNELNRFINIAIGSLYETFAALDILKDNKLITETDFAEGLRLINTIDNQLGGFKKKIKKVK